MSSVNQSHIHSAAPRPHHLPLATTFAAQIRQVLSLRAECSDNVEAKAAQPATASLALLSTSQISIYEEDQQQTVVRVGHGDLEEMDFEGANGLPDVTAI